MESGSPSVVLPSVALQEWTAVCDALAAGDICLLVRKGGIHERGGGLFAPEHERFLLMRSHVHQEATRLREPLRPRAAVASEARDEQRILPALATVAGVWRVCDLTRLLRCAAETPWTDEELERRFRYRDRPEVFVLALRVWVLASALRLRDHPGYHGCRSWIRLQDAPPPRAPAHPVLTDEEAVRRFARIGDLLES